MRRLPAYCVHKGRNLAYMTIHGREHYLGRAHSPESHAAYREALAAVLAGEPVESTRPARRATALMQEPWQPPRKGWRMRVEPTNRWAQKPPRTRHKAHRGEGSSRPWQRLSKALRANHPLCQVCGTRPSTEVHHIKPWCTNPESRLDPRNLLAVCRSCHERLEVRTLLH